MAGALLMAWVVFLPSAGAATAPAPEPEPSGGRIVRVEIHGNVRVPTDRILGQIRLREGGTFSSAAMDEDLKRVIGLGEFDNVLIRPVRTPEGLVLDVTVIERPVLAAMEFVGARHFSPKDLAETVGLASGAAIDRGKLFAGVRAIERKYRDTGYHFVHVALDVPLLNESRIARYTITEGPRVRISKITFTGNASIGTDELKKQMESSAYFPIFSAGTFDENQLARDLTAIRNYYIEQGFRDVRVGRELKFSADNTRLEVAVIIEEGPLYHVRSVVLEGAKRFSPALLEKQLTLVPGAPYTADRVKHDLKLIHDTYGEVGYIDADVKPTVDFAAEPGLVDVTFKIEEGEAYRIGEIKIEGNTVTQDRVIRRDLRFFPEEPVNTKLIERAQRRLEGTGLFVPDSIQIIPTPTQTPGVANLTVKVDEAQTGRMLFGAGISSNDGIVGNISFVERNFDLLAWPKSLEDFRRGRAFRGAGQFFDIALEPGTQLQDYHIDWRDPHVFDSDYSLGTSLFFFKRDRDTYNEQRAGIRFGFGKELRPGLQGFLNFRVEGIDISSIDAGVPKDVTDVAGTSSLTSVEVGVIKDTTDSFLSPSEGYRWSASIEQAGALGGSYTFTKINADARRYWTVTRDVLDRRSVLSVRGAIGGILGDAPIFERFYAGGLGTIRGFRFRGVGPREGDTELGGKFMALASAEYSFPIFEKSLTGVLFLDTGTVEKEFTITTWRAAAGFGVRFTVPFFGAVPFSLNFGFPIAKGAGDRTEFFSFSLGASF